MNKTAEAMKAIIDRDGLGCLDTNPYDVYTELIKTNATDARTARMILITLLAGTHKQKKLDADSLSSYIRQECSLDESAADEMAGIYAELFSTGNRKTWKGNTEKGFKEFCEKQWHFDLESFSRWSADYVYIDSNCTLNADLEVSDKDTLHKALEKLLRKNPFTTAEAIYDLLKKDFQKMLDEDFDWYCNAEEYYPPTAEDYSDNGEDVVNNFCAKYGMKIVSYECVGQSDDSYQSYL